MRKTIFADFAHLKCAFWACLCDKRNKENTGAITCHNKYQNCTAQPDLHSTGCIQLEPRKNYNVNYNNCVSASPSLCVRTKLGALVWLYLHCWVHVTKPNEHKWVRSGAKVWSISCLKLHVKTLKISPASIQKEKELCDHLHRPISPLTCMR